MKKRVLLVDDDSNLLDFYKDELNEAYDLTTAISGSEGLRILKEFNSIPLPFPVIVSDYNMPEMDGIQFLSEARKMCPDTVRIMLTASSDIQTAVNAVSEGNVFRFLTKPCNSHTLSKNISAGIDQYNLITAEKALLEKTLLGAVGILIDILSIVNPEIFAQALRLRTLAKRIITRLQLSDTWELEIGLLLSHIGCISIPTDILNKKVSGQKLSDSENNLYLSHPISGYKFLSKIPRLERIAEAIKHQYDEVMSDDQGSSQIVHLNTLLHDYDKLMQEGKTSVQAIEHLNKNRSEYDLTFLEALEAEILQIKRGLNLKLIPFKELQNGDVVADDIVSKSGLSLVKKETEISEVLLDRLAQFQKREPIIEPIKIISRSTTENK